MLIKAIFALASILFANPWSPVTTTIADRSASVAPSVKLDELARARPRELAVALQVRELGHLSITARFRLRGSGAPGELRVDLWTHADAPVAEVAFSVRRVQHLTVRQVYGADEKRVWMSPRMEAELERGTPRLMSVYWAVMTDPRLYTKIDNWLATLPPDPLAVNPACGVTKWGLKILVWVAGVGCCAIGSVPGCIVCTVGSNAGTEIINESIDCKKECKPDCPIP